jgi:DUF1680 family protein
MSRHTSTGRLAPNAFAPLPLGTIRPAGWIARQLRIQADGLSGYLDEFWPDVADSAWIGGAAEGWERAPYWLDGLVPLAFLLDDPRLRAKADRWVNEILIRQHDDGWLGPLKDTSDARRIAYDPWPVFVLLKALAQYQEATGDARIIPAMLRFGRRLEVLLAEQPLFDWGRYRWADLAVSLFWLYERTGAAWLLDLAEASYRQAFDWRALFAQFPYREKQRIEQIHPPAPPEPRVTFRTDLASHVVNNAMALKQPALWSRLSHDEGDRTAVFHMIDTLDTYHGQATGLFSGDEHLAGQSPSQGTELCAVVEYLYSLEVLLATGGDARLADRLERIAFNALPATFSPDMWAHQYVQQANQAICAVVEDRIYTNNRGDANIFGLEPQYGCCTANMHQGWPKLVSHLWMRAPDGGLAAISYAPCVVRTEAGGSQVRIAVTTDYPFEETIRLTVTCDHPATFALHLRVPAWAEGATLTAGDGTPEALAAGEFVRVEHEWGEATTLTLHFPMRVQTLKRPHGAVALLRGPLLFALPVGAEWRTIREWGAPEVTAGAQFAADWEVHPITPWAYALILDPDRPEQDVTVAHAPVSEVPFAPDAPPVTLKVTGRQVAGWNIEHGTAAPPPTSPVEAEGMSEELTLVPYGCAPLRMTELPMCEGRGMRDEG